MSKLTKVIRQEIQARRMTPVEYCEKWLPILYNVEYGDSGSRQYCVMALMDALTLKYPTVNAWGAKFERYSNKEKTEMDLARQSLINSFYHQSKALAAQERV